jgi:hypothetical protein
MVDPTSVRLSENFLLSDLCGGHSFYVRGIPNVFDDPTGIKIVEGVCLAETVLEPIVQTSPISISFGYVGDSAAGKLHGNYPNPDATSLHQWSNGAACDIVVHNLDALDISPITIARAIDEEFPMNRTITYSESPFICVGTKAAEINSDRPRKAFYENRYEGVYKAKPKFTTIPQNREAFFRTHRLEHNWRGGGHPSYHGGGVRQVHHIRTSRFTMLSDFLYSTEALTEGHKNCPTLTEDWVKKFKRVGTLYDGILTTLGIHRLSIVRAYESAGWNKGHAYRWTDNTFEIDFIPSSLINPDEVAQAASKLKGVVSVSVDDSERRVSVKGIF